MTGKDLIDDQQELTYGIVREYGNGTTIWFEPITDDLDGFVLRKPEGDIESVFSKDREAEFLHSIFGKGQK